MTKSRGPTPSGVGMFLPKNRLLILLSIGFLSACEAPLKLEQVASENAKERTRYDMFQAAAHHGERVVVVSSTGAVILSQDNGKTWQRTNLPGRPSLIDIDVCDNGTFVALDSEKRTWTKAREIHGWSVAPIETTESTLSLHCAPGNRLWVTASFGTLYSRSIAEDDWQEFSLYEDLQFTKVRFVDERHGFAVGEFGTVVATTDGGQNWQIREAVPNEFYPMASDFADTERGWVGGLDGVIWKTEDGGNSWIRQETENTSPIYSIRATDQGVFAVGGNAKIIEYVNDKWQPVRGAPEVLTFLRGVDLLDNGYLLVAGGGGTLELMPRDSQSAEVQNFKGIPR